jgi:hypothetical protein
MNSILLNRKVFDLPSTNVRSAIIETVRKQMPGTAFAKPLIEHLEKMGKRVLDPYNDIEIALKEHNVVLRFRTSRQDGEAMRYTLDALPGEPNEAFKKTWRDMFRL